MQKAPAQHSGAQSDIRYSKKATNETEGFQLYEKARKNLLSINQWQQLAGKVSAAFLLTDHYGKRADRYPLNGDYIRIHLPSSTDGKYEWVRIERVEEQPSSENFNSIVMQVRPSDPPKEQEETEHFFSKEATSSFSVERNGEVVTAFVKGRNELPNLEAPGLLNKIRNTLIALAAMAGANTPQWKGLAKGIIDK